MFFEAIKIAQFFYIFVSKPQTLTLAEVTFQKFKHNFDQIRQKENVKSSNFQDIL